MAANLKRLLAPQISELGRAHKDALVSITRVDVSPDLRVSKVFLSVMGKKDGAETVRQIATHAHELQRTVASSLQTKQTPSLRFALDTRMADSDRLDQLISGNQGKSALDG